MAYFPWKEEYNLGIGQIDKQHVEIVKLMNELYDSIHYAKENYVIKDVFVRLLKYANYHFTLELELFQKYHYAEERIHIDEHKYYINKVKTIMINELLTEKNAALDVLHFLRSWFENHMMKTDREYCNYFIRKKIMEEIDKFLLGLEDEMKFEYD